MVYNVIGLMSGSSLDGLDIAYVELTEISGQWSFELKAADTIPFQASMATALKQCRQLPIEEFFKLHTSFGKWMGEAVNTFIHANNLHHKIHFIASHGHTAYHNPEAHTTFQLGDGASIAAATKLNVITDLRAADVARGGQGAPIVPIMEQMLLRDYAYCLNIGGIANITINNVSPIAFDICAANQVLNHFSELLGQPFDLNGDIARSGTVDETLLAQINALSYFHTPAPKSLDNAFSQSIIETLTPLSPADALATATRHIAMQVAAAVLQYPSAAGSKLLITGGGAKHSYLIETIESLLPNITIVIPDAAFIDYKEAIAMALIGALRWREETNVLSSVTGATEDSVNGALWVN